MLAPPDFADLLDGDPLPLDRACLVIARSVRGAGGLDIDDQVGRIDDIAASLPEPTLDGLTRVVFDEMGFQGNRGDYYDPANSYLDKVLDRRRGIPITLSVLCMEVGRRVGVPLAGVGMPGHFLLRDQVDQSLYLDPFRRGARMSVGECAELFASIHGPQADFDARMLEPVSAPDIVTRILANLRQIFIRRADGPHLARVLVLLSAVPGVGPGAMAEAVDVLSAVGRFDLAALAAEQLADTDPDAADDHLATASRLRARLN